MSRILNSYATILEKAAMTGVITGATSGVTTGFRFNVPMPFTNRVMPLWLFCACAGVISSTVNDGIHYLVKQEVHISKKGKDEASLYLGAVAGAVTYWALVGVANKYLQRDIGSATLLLTGAFAEVSSSIGYNMLKG